MSLMKSLARVAAGVIVAKGIGSVMQNRNQGGTTARGRTTGGGILGDLFGQGGSTAQGSGGGLAETLGRVLGGGQTPAGSGQRYGGSNSPGRAQGGLGGMFDQLSGAAGGVLGGVLGGTLAQRGSQPQNDASFGELFNDAITRQDEPQIAPTPEQNALAGLMLKAMIQAAKADGQIDEAERARLLDQIGDLDDDERAFIRDQMAAPVDVAALAREVPRGMEGQIYSISVMAIDFDSEAEARYLHDLAQALGLEKAVVNGIHNQLGVTPLYA
ncbi:MAG: tellurite resistance TerB family protein [Paracoccus sp. (in: a-proteobacteria)]|nr:tellurite resistance TerB family protein [Paracoccus sp. (in: a-proteobacteria)]